MFNRIKNLCQNKGISIAKLERDLNFANGSIAKSDEKISAYRLHAIAEYFHVSMEYLLYGKNYHEQTAPLVESIADMGYEICDVENPQMYYERGSFNGDLTPTKGDGKTYGIGVRTSSYEPPQNEVYWTSENFLELLADIQKMISNKINGIKKTDIDTSFEHDLYEAYKVSEYKDAIDHLLTIPPKGV